MKKTYILFSMLCVATSLMAQTQLTTSELSSLYTTAGGSWVSIHDPSVVYRNGSYYIWGSHLGVASSDDLVKFTSLSANNSTFRKLANQGASSGTACDYSSAFNTQQVTEVKNYKGETVSMPNFDAAAYCTRYTDDKDGWLSGDMWAPDIIWNENMQKWCMYLSLNGDNWSSIIILLTSDSPTTGFTYQAPVVMGGFNGQSGAPSFAETDLDIALGVTSIPSRYLQGDSNGDYWPNPIDPCVFFDEEGELWMTYGSWSGGIFMLKLDKETGLRDYTYTYDSDYSSKGASGTSDPYYGLKIAGGYYVSGEGSYIQHIGDYYYLFMSYGLYAPDGGYEMRIFRSVSPDGPYKDANGNTATYTGWQLNYGPGAGTNKGMLLMEAYNDWGGIQDIGERSQGHNSACQDDEGRNFVVYHTKFNDGTDGHQVRVHQLFTNQNGWLVAAPFGYRGETTTDESIATTQQWTLDELVGEYYVLMHPYMLDHDNYEEMVPSVITLTADGNVTGEMSGTWGMTDGTGYMWIRVSGTTYYGVLCDQTINGATASGLEDTSLKAIAFTTTANSGVPLWGYKLQPEYAIAWNYANGTINVKDNQTIDSNVSLMFDTDNNTTLSWASSEPDIISETGKYSPEATATSVTLTARLECGDYFWEESYNVTAEKDITPTGDYLSGLVAYYNFDESPTYNQYKPSTETEYDRITYSKFGSGTAPSLEVDYDRFGQVAHVQFGANGLNSYARMPNPLLNLTDIEGFTVSAWIKRTDDDAWGDLWGFWNTTSYSGNSARFYLTGNSYLGYNDNKDTWFDINYPDVAYTDIPVGEWTLVTVTVGATNKVRIYINGANKSVHTISASNNATAVKDLPISELIANVTGLQYFCLGNGGYWGSADYCIDDLLIYNRELSSTDVRALNAMSNRVTDFTIGENGTDVEDIAVNQTVHGGRYADGVYDLSGRRIVKPTSGGIYIQNGKKIIK